MCMQPRRAPDSCPVAPPRISFELRGERRYAAEIRNGLPAPRYRYAGTGQAMSPDEARWWLENLADCRICAD